MTQQSQLAIETGFQVYTRLSSINRPSIIHLDDKIFGKPLEPKQSIELTGESNCGKSFFLTHIIAKALIQGTRIILIETDNTMNFSTLITLLESDLKKEENSEEISSEKQMEIIENCLKNLIILRCYNDFDLEVVLLSKLDEILLADLMNITLIAVDSISAYYWTEFNPEEPMRMDTYFTNILKRFKRICDDYNLILAYTRPSSFTSVIRLQDDKLIDYRIELLSVDDNIDDYNNDDVDSENVFEAKISSSDKTVDVKNFTISSFGINWIE